MPIVININSGKDYEPVSEGVHAAVLADIVDLGPVQTAFGIKDKVQFTWLTDEADEDGKTKYLFKRYTKSLHEKSNLRKDVEKILGRPLGQTEQFDLESLLGQNNQLVVQHNEAPDGSGKVYANIVGIMKPKAKLAIPQDFQRKKDREPQGQLLQGRNAQVKAAGGGRAVAAAIAAPAQIGDDDLPF